MNRHCWAPKQTGRSAPPARSIYNTAACRNRCCTRQTGVYFRRLPKSAAGRHHHAEQHPQRLCGKNPDKKTAESVRSEISYSKLQKTLRAVNVSLAKETIADYIRYAEDAYLLFHLQNYYANLVEKESYPKFYFSDNGIVSLFLDRKESVQLENMVAVALTRAYPDDVYYLKSAKTGIDIDFYVPSIGLAVQAAYSIAGDAREREVGQPEKLAQNSQGAARLVIVTYEEEETIIEDGVTIEAVPLYKFLLELENGKYGTAY